MDQLLDIAALITFLSFYIHKKLIAEQEFNYSLWVHGLCWLSSHQRKYLTSSV